jgi:hypothetical protein
VSPARYFCRAASSMTLRFSRNTSTFSRLSAPKSSSKYSLLIAQRMRVFPSCLEKRTTSRSKSSFSALSENVRSCFSRQGISKVTKKISSRLYKSEQRALSTICKVPEGRGERAILAGRWAGRAVSVISSSRPSDCNKVMSIHSTVHATNMRDEEWVKKLEDGRTVKFTYQELRENGAFITAQIGGNEVVYSVVLVKARNPLSHEDVESHFEGELSKR